MDQYESMTDGRTVLGSSETMAMMGWCRGGNGMFPGFRCLLGPNLINLHGELHLLPTTHPYRATQNDGQTFILQKYIKAVCSVVGVVF